ncbi:energy transducer TonB [Haliscomenobacter sp.]|uniref:energy transducer TonB n=1 Tax=Haliscomenobacter sp. TaxID=2717303 RepID=UPI003365207F
MPLRKSVLQLPLLTSVFFSMIGGLLFAQNPTPKDSTVGPVYTKVEFMPTFPGGSEALKAFLAENVGYPKPALASGVEEKIEIQFVVDREGFVKNPRIIRGLNDTANQDALRVMRQMPQWNPGLNEDLPVAVEMSLNIPYRMSPIFKVVQNMPAFAEGQAAMLRFLDEHLKYPELARQNRTEGVVVVQFVVETDGLLSNLYIVKELGSGCDEEALRLVKSMPPWQPGVSFGNLVRVQFNLPIRFKIKE